MDIRFAGLDWASQVHAVCVIDKRGAVVVSSSVDHDRAGLAEMCRGLKKVGVTSVAIERPCGLIVDVLLEAGFTVVPIHPNIVKATRSRYCTHGGKSDASDAYLLADLLRTDGHRFNPLRPQSPAIRGLRALVRGRQDLVDARVRQANQLRTLLESFWPGAAGVFCEIDSPIALAFIERFPTPASASRLGVARMAAFCARHGYSGRRSPEELLQRLRRAPSVSVAEPESQSLGELTLCLVRTLQTLSEQIRLLTRRIERDVAELEDGQILMSLPRAGRLGAAQILAELGSERERFDSDQRLAAEAGVTPVTRNSGKFKSVGFRWACNHRLRAALTRLADASRHANEWAAAIYAKARARGCTHPHAVRVLARAWVRVIWRIWTDRIPYDPALHGGARSLLKTRGG